MMSLTISNHAYGQVNQDNIQAENLGHEAEKKQGHTQKKGIEKTIFAGDLNLLEDPVAKKRKEAQQKAMKVIQDAWNRDREVEETIQERMDQYDKMMQLKEEAMDVVQNLEENKAALREEYGIDADSQEQKDLELLERMQNCRAGLKTKGFTEEEQKRLSELVQEPLTEYQKMALDLNGQQIKFKKDMQNAEDQMKMASASVRSIKLEKLKFDPMVEARKAADKIMESASKEIIGLVGDQAVDHIDKELEEDVEEAKDAAEKKEEKEEQQEEIKEKRALQEAVIAKTKEAVEKAEAIKRQHSMPDISVEETLNLTQTSAQTQDVQKMLDDIKHSMNLLEADLKGIKVDEQV